VSSVDYAVAQLILKRASLPRPSGEWSDDDYDVLADGVVVGRIMKAAAKSPDASWLWAARRRTATRRRARQRWPRSPRVGGGSKGPCADARAPRLGGLFPAAATAEEAAQNLPTTGGADHPSDGQRRQHCRSAREAARIPGRRSTNRSLGSLGWDVCRRRTPSGPIGVHCRASSGITARAALSCAVQGVTTSCRFNGGASSTRSAVSTWPRVNSQLLGLGQTPSRVPRIAAHKAQQPPSGPLWLREIKQDSFRVVARKDGGRVRLYSRLGNDLTTALLSYLISHAVLCGMSMAV
jgi:hypothetical protein